MLNVLPNQKGKLSNDADITRLVGAELEFHPVTHSMFEWRQILFERGVDTFDDGYQRPPSRTGASESVDACGTVIPNPQRLRDLPTPEDARSRGVYVHQLVNIDMPNDRSGSSYRYEEYNAFVNQFPQSIRPERQGATWSAAFYEAVAAKYRRPDSVAFRRWNLGTDPTAGLELRTPPLTIGEGLFDALDAVGQAFEDGGAEANRSCGGHVHIDMRDKTFEQRKRVFATYVMCEPLIMAACNPSRYQRSYNTPLWNSQWNLGSLVPSGVGTNHSAATPHTSLLNTAALSEHGTLEWRQFEGVTEMAEYRNWITLILRFTQAAEHKWGVKMSRLVPVKVTTESVQDFIDYLDMDRADCTDRVKEARDWYLERISTYKDRDAFERRLVAAPNLADLRKLKAEGKSHDTQPAIVFDPAHTQTKNVAQIGQKFLAFVTQLVGLGSVRATTAGVPNVLDALGTDAMRSYIENWAEETRYDGNTEAIGDDLRWNVFVEAVRRFDAEAVGQWLCDVIYTGDATESRRIEMIVNTVHYWVQGWAYNSVGYQTITNLFRTQTQESAGCVDF